MVFQANSSVPSDVKFTCEVSTTNASQTKAESAVCRLDIDLENPEDVKVIHDEFKKLYDSDENFRQSFGEEALQLMPL